MLDSSAAYHAAITGDARRIFLKAIIDIIDPDIVYGTVESSGAASVCKPEQLHDKIQTLVPYATFEPNRWALNGAFQLFPLQDWDQGGFIGNVLSGTDGAFDPPVWVELRLSNVSILQACSVYFPTAVWDGVPADFVVEVKQGGTAYYTKNVTGNTAPSISLDGFTVNNPDAIRLTVSRWSLPGRRLRVPEIIPGIYETWDNSILATFRLNQQVNFSCLALPYGTCTLSVDNLDRRFEPRSKNGAFRSIEERQGITVSIGVELLDGSVSYQPKGVYYQSSGGWKAGDNGLTMQWDLVDIVGLVSGRQYFPPDPLPTTLKGWIASIVAQLGKNFENRYRVDPNYADIPVTARSVNDVKEKSCGEILRMACMAAGVFPRADDRTGYLAAEPLWNQGYKVTLDNLERYPVIKANDDLAAIIFTLADESNTEYVVSGNNTTSGDTVAVQNPFIHTKAEALTAARLILSTYGGNQLETVGRGDPAAEMGDVDTVWLDRSAATAGRRMSQSFDLSSGVLKGCQSVLLQADGSFLFQNRTVITKSGSWTAPESISRLRVILVGGGSGGQNGTDGTWDEAGEDGPDGEGGLVWAGTIDINPQQTFDVTIGRGGAPGQPGTATVMGPYTSAVGTKFSPNYTDIASGDVFSRAGVPSPILNTGDGGSGGSGGVKGNRHEKTWTDADGNTHYDTVIDNSPGNGRPGTPGASGCVVVYWDKEAD